MIDYAGNEIKINGCYGCAFADHKFSIPSGIIWEDDAFTLAQDWALPIVGFIVLAPKKHVEYLNELSTGERNKMFEIVNKTINALKKLKVCKEYNVIFEEEQGSHFHIWLMPRHDWMFEKFENPIKSIGEIFSYAKNNLKTPTNINKINSICQKLKELLKLN